MTPPSFSDSDSATCSSLTQTTFWPFTHTIYQHTVIPYHTLERAGARTMGARIDRCGQRVDISVTVVQLVSGIKKTENAVLGAFS